MCAADPTRHNAVQLTCNRFVHLVPGQSQATHVKRLIEEGSRLVSSRARNRGSAWQAF
jgi:hypothetical protein